MKFTFLELNMRRIKIPYAIFRDTPFLYFKPLQRRKKFSFFFFFSNINPSIIAFSTLALLTEPQRLDARLSDVHFIEPPGTRAYTRLSLARIAAQTSNEQNDESTSRCIYPCRVNRVALVQVTGPLYIYKVSNKITDPWINKRRHQFALDIID